MTIGAPTPANETPRMSPIDLVGNFNTSANTSNVIVQGVVNRAAIGSPEDPDTYTPAQVAAKIQVSTPIMKQSEGFNYPSGFDTYQTLMSRTELEAQLKAKEESGYNIKNSSEVAAMSVALDMVNEAEKSGKDLGPAVKETYNGIELASPVAPAATSTIKLDTPRQ